VGQRLLTDWTRNIGDLEDYLVIVSITLIGVFVLIGARMFQPKNKVKSTTSKAKDVLSKVNEETIERLSSELRKSTGRANRLQALRNNDSEEEEETPEDGRKPVTFEEIQALVNTSYPKYAALLPLLKKQVMDATKGMTMEEVLGYVKQFTGNKQSQGNVATQDAAGYNPNWA